MRALQKYSFLKGINLRKILSITCSIAVFSLFPETSFSANCNKTVMGGGCTSQAEPGIAPHMRSQAAEDKATKTQPAAKSAIKVDPSIKAVKVSDVTK